MRRRLHLTRDFWNACPEAIHRDLKVETLYIIKHIYQYYKLSVNLCRVIGFLIKVSLRLSQIVTDVMFFLSAVDHLCVSAGSYFMCTRSVIITLFSVLTTYVAVPDSMGD